MIRLEIDNPQFEARITDLVESSPAEIKPNPMVRSILFAVTGLLSNEEIHQLILLKRVPARAKPALPVAVPVVSGVSGVSGGVASGVGK